MARFGDLIGRTVKAVHIEPGRYVQIETSGWWNSTFTIRGDLHSESGDDPADLIDARIEDCYCDTVVDNYGATSTVVIETTDGYHVVFDFYGKVDIG